MSDRKYTQQEWDREVGWGSVPEEYAYTIEEKDEQVQDSDHAYEEAMKGI